MSESPKMPEPMRARLARLAEVVEAAGYLRGLDKRAPSDYEPAIAKLVNFTEAACRESYLSGWTAAREEAAKTHAPLPLEPTPAMCAAGFAVSEGEHDPAGVYRAMVAAAIRSMPPPEGEQEKRDASS